MEDLAINLGVVAGRLSKSVLTHNKLGCRAKYGHSVSNMVSIEKRSAEQKEKCEISNGDAIMLNTNK